MKVTMPYVYAFVLGVAIVAPYARTRSSRSLLGPLVVLAAYALGVLNERDFPGDRSVPLPGELPYWAGLVVLVFVGGVLTRRS
jgi:hypothetical protein